MGMGAEMLTSLSVPELEALADGLLAPARQSRLDELLAKNSARAIIGDERRELDHLLELADQLTVLKTRARYTLHHLRVAAAGL
jgi:anti-sigma factor RsiW